LEQFVAVTNYIRHQIVHKVGVGTLEDKKKSEASIVVKVCDEFKTLKRPDWPLSTRTVCDEAKCQLEEIEFIRLNTHWFDASFETCMTSEGDLERWCGIASHLDIVDEMAFFASELSLPDFRNADYAEKFREIMSLSSDSGSKKGGPGDASQSGRL
jgi:hypothetical protein